MANRRIHTHAIPVGPLAKVVVVAFFLAAAGLSYVYFKNQLCTSGTQIKKLEHELSELETQNELVRGRIALLSSRTVLQRRLNEGFIKMIPISDDRILRFATPSRMAGDELRAVSNEGGVR